MFGPGTRGPCPSLRRRAVRPLRGLDVPSSGVISLDVEVRDDSSDRDAAAVLQRDLLPHRPVRNLTLEPAHVAPIFIDEQVPEAHASEDLPVNESLCCERQSQHSSHEPKESCPRADPLPCATPPFPQPHAVGNGLTGPRVPQRTEAANALPARPGLERRARFLVPAADRFVAGRGPAGRIPGTRLSRARCECQHHNLSVGCRLTAAGPARLTMARPLANLSALPVATHESRQRGVSGRGRGRHSSTHFFGQSHLGQAAYSCRRDR
jgi:hypothetical protein